MFQHHLQHFPGNEANKPGTRATPCHLKAAAHLKATVHEDGVVLLSITQGKVFSGNRVAAEIWHAISEGKSLDEVAVLLGERYPARKTEVNADLSKFVGELISHHLLVPSEGA
jgi:hypothetical protein